jgi:hypothetical protein
MKVFLQNSRTRLYRAQECHWTADEAEAFNFPCCMQALRHARNCGLAEFEVVLKFDEAEAYERCLDIPGNFTNPAPVPVAAGADTT